MDLNIIIQTNKVLLKQHMGNYIYIFFKENIRK